MLILLSLNSFASNQARVTAEVIPLTHDLKPGDVVDIAVIFTMKDDWHIYWQNPGDAGMPTSFQWTLPENFKIIDRQEPTPTRHVDEGIHTFIHEDGAIFMFKLQAPAQLPDSNSLALDIQWLECKELCQPGASHHEFSLPTGNAQNEIKTAEWETLLKQAERHFPKAHHFDKIQVAHKGNRVEVIMGRGWGGQKIHAADFFPYDEMVFDASGPVQVKHGFLKDLVAIPLLDDSGSPPEHLGGILVLSQGTPQGNITKNFIIDQAIQ